jgi:hypothetical protein
MPRWTEESGGDSADRVDPVGLRRLGIGEHRDRNPLPPAAQQRRLVDELPAGRFSPPPHVPRGSRVDELDFFDAATHPLGDARLRVPSLKVWRFRLSRMAKRRLPSPR